jgi:hypothetical protein
MVAIQLTGGQQTPASCGDEAVRDRASGTGGWRNGPWIPPRTRPYFRNIKGYLTAVGIVGS